MSVYHLASPPTTHSLVEMRLLFDGPACHVAHPAGLFFSELVVAGFIQMSQQKVELNTINVFPIPDGDTGTWSAVMH